MQALARTIASGQRRQQAPGVGVLRAREQFVDRSALHDPAGVHHGHLVTDLCHHTQVMGNQDDRRIDFAAQVAHQFENLGLRRDIERRRRLVGDQQSGPVEQCHCDHHTLTHAARQLVRIGLETILRAGNTNGSQPGNGQSARLAFRHFLMQPDGLFELPADRHDGIE